MTIATDSPYGPVKELLNRLSACAAEQNLTDKALAEKLGIPYSTLKKWMFFTSGKEAREPSPEHRMRINEFLEAKDEPELFAQKKESRRRAEKVKYLLILLEDELRWFQGVGPLGREEFRKTLDAPDVGYISSLLSMLTDEEKFNRWLALTTAHFNAFKGN